MEETTGELDSGTGRRGKLQRGRRGRWRDGELQTYQLQRQNEELMTEKQREKAEQKK